MYTVCENMGKLSDVLERYWISKSVLKNIMIVDNLEHLKNCLDWFGMTEHDLILSEIILNSFNQYIKIRLKLFMDVLHKTFQRKANG